MLVQYAAVSHLTVELMVSRKTFPDFSFLLSSELPALKARTLLCVVFLLFPKKEAVCLYLLSPTVCLITTTPPQDRPTFPGLGSAPPEPGAFPSYIASARIGRKHLVCLFASLTSSAEKTDCRT